MFTVRICKTIHSLIINCTGMLLTAAWLLLLSLSAASALSCHNTKCKGTTNYTNILIPCDNSVNKCSYNKTGYPVCEPTSEGTGVNCKGRYKCRYDQDSGEAYCSSKSGSWQCYDQKCTGRSQFPELSLKCDNKDNYCSHNSTGFPACRATKWGGDGVSCNGEDCSVEEGSGEGYCVSASKTLYYIWGGVVGGAALMSAVLYLIIKCVRRVEHQHEGTDTETERLVPEKTDKTDYRRRFSGNERPKGKWEVRTGAASETDHIYANV